jgi:mannose-1-phosphate guanylyltransferase
MKCLVLAAGMSTRLTTLTGGVPKPLVPVAGMPVLHRNLRWLASQGISNCFINLHYRADEIRRSVGDGSAFGMRVTWSEENPILGTAGAAKKLEKELCSEPRFLVVYGDNVFGFDLNKMIVAHHKALERHPDVSSTMAIFDQTTHFHTGIAGGGIIANPDLEVTELVEGMSNRPTKVNAACYVVESGVLDLIAPPPAATDWMRDVFPASAKSGSRLMAHMIDGYCLGIDTPEAYARAQELFASGRVK